MRSRTIGMVLAMTGVWAGCAARQRPHDVIVGAPAVPRSAATPVPESFEHYVARVRALAQQAAPARQRPPVASLESTDPVLRAALARLALEPTPEQHRAVAAAYLRAGISDHAFDHFTAAVRLDRTDAAAYDGLARIWRDWGFAHLGLNDASHAVFYAPRSAAAQNTLGTLLQALGQRQEARRAYKAALDLDPRAAYALNNLCTLGLEQGQLSDATATCRQALSLDPTLLAARRNLATLLALETATGPRTATMETESGTDGSGKPPGD
jgi:Flp pilus assembly protein TadD